MEDQCLLHVNHQNQMTTQAVAEGGSSLLQDMTNLLKLLKQREDNHIALVDYIAKMLDYIPTPNVFLDQELNQHYNFARELKHKEHTLFQVEGHLRHTFSQHTSLDNQSLRMVHKLNERVLEICHSSVDKLKIRPDLYDTEFRAFKDSFTRLLQDRSLTEVVEASITYSKDKFHQDQGLLQALIEAIQNGEREQMGALVSQRFRKIQDKIQQQRARQKRVKEEEMRVLRERQREKEEERTRLQEKMDQAVETQKLLVKNKKKVSKFVDNVLSKLYSPLSQFSKSNFTQGMVFADEFGQKQRLLHQILERNRLVQSEIVKFVSYSSHIHDRIKIFATKKPSNSSPKLNISQRVATSKEHTLSQNKIIANFSSIETVPELPPIKDTHKRISSDKDPAQEPLEFNNIGTLITKQSLFMSSVASSRVEITSPYQLAIFDTVKSSGDKRKESMAIDGLPHISTVERVSLDANKERLATPCRSNPKVLQVGSFSKYKRRSETPQMLMPLIQLSIPNKFSMKIAPRENPDLTATLKKLIN